MTIDNLTAYQRAQQLFLHVVEQVPSDAWETPSACEEWTVRDVVGHLVWGMELACSCAAGQETTDRRGAPGAPHPAEFLASEPADAVRNAMALCRAALPEGLDQPAPGLARQAGTLGDFLGILTADMNMHTWDITSSVGLPMTPDPDVLAVAKQAVLGGVRRADGFFKPEITPPADASDFEQLIAFLGRDPRQP